MSDGSRPRRALIVEDDPLSLALTQRLLRKQGFDMVVATTGEDAVALATAANEPVDVIFLDNQLPDFDGREVARRIRDHEQTAGKHTPIIACSAHDSRELQQGFLDAGMDDVLAKPIKADRLLAALAKLTLR